MPLGNEDEDDDEYEAGGTFHNTRTHTRAPPRPR